MHLVNGYTIKCGCIGLMLFRNLSCVEAIICDINTIGFGKLGTIGFDSVFACRVRDALVASCATVHKASMNENGRHMLIVHVT